MRRLYKMQAKNNDFSIQMSIYYQTCSVLAEIKFLFFAVDHGRVEF